MPHFANCALVYKNAEGLKIRRKAGSIFDDAPEGDVKSFESRALIREATVGEIAEAVAAGLLDKKYLPKGNAAAEKKGAAAAEKKGAADAGDGGAGAAGEANKRPNLV